MKSSDSTAPRTLLADDEPDVLEALRVLLKGEGYQIEAATSPAAVINSLEAGSELASGDRILLFTDGATEAVNPEEEEFGEERLIELLKPNLDLGAEDLQKKVFETVAEFSGNNCL